MPYGPISKQHLLLGANTSNQTGAVALIADYAFISVSIQSTASNGSRWTFMGSNDNGITAALGTPSQTVNQNGWSLVTTIVNSGLYTISAPFRWLTCFRDGVSAASMTTITLDMRT